MFKLQVFKDRVDVIKDNKVLSLSYEDLQEESCKEFWETKILTNVKTVEYYWIRL
jgi:hypothetical protein